jgi:pilus assembly protein CpaB
MRKRRPVALAIAIVPALIAGMVFRTLLQKKPETTSANVVQVASVDTVDVLIAAQDLSTGDQLGAALKWKPWPKDAMLSQMITRDNRPNAFQELANARARQPIYQNEPISEPKLLMPGAGGFMAATLPQGMRAVSMTISSRSSAGGFILPNDRVDVILTTKFKDPKIARPVVLSETVLSDARVLAVNQVYKQASDKDAVAVAKGETATLELTPEQAEVIAQVEAKGELSLALRSLAEDNGKAKTEVGPKLAGKYSKSSEIRPGSQETIILRAGVATSATN